MIMMLTMITMMMIVGVHTDLKLEMYPRNNTAQHAQHNHTMIKEARSRNIYVAFY